MIYHQLGILILLFLSASFAENRHIDKMDNFLTSYEDIDISIEDGSIVLTCKYNQSEYLELTDDNNLYVNGEKIQLDDSQKQLVADYYDLLSSIIEYAKVIGVEGARIGVAGAKIGLKALAGVMKVLFTEYESEELEEDMEVEGEQLEEMAHDLEDKAEDLEQLAKSLEKTHIRMHKEIPEIRDIEWF